MAKTIELTTIGTSLKDNGLQGMVEHPDFKQNFIHIQQKANNLYQSVVAYMGIREKTANTDTSIDEYRKAVAENWSSLLKDFGIAKKGDRKIPLYSLTYADFAILGETASMAQTEGCYLANGENSQQAVETSKAFLNLAIEQIRRLLTGEQFGRIEITSVKDVQAEKRAEIGRKAAETRKKNAEKRAEKQTKQKLLEEKAEILEGIDWNGLAVVLATAEDGNFDELKTKVNNWLLENRPQVSA